MVDLYMTPSVSLHPDFLQGVVRQATFQCRADGSAFYLRDRDLGAVSLVASHNLPTIPWDDGLPDRVFTARETVFETCSHKTILLAAPLIWQDAVRGVLVVFNGARRHAFRDRDKALLQSLGSITEEV